MRTTNWEICCMIMGVRKKQNRLMVRPSALIRAMGTVTLTWAIYFSARRQLREAEVAYREALRINPQDAEAYNGLGNVLRVLRCFVWVVQIRS